MLSDCKNFKRTVSFMNEITRDGLLASAENESTYFMDFNAKCTEHGVSYVYCFVENYDLSFYPHRVEDILGNKATGIPCDGKKNVLNVFTLIKSKPEYNKYSTRFFVDADFDDNSGIDQHVYVTTCYSIENLFTDEEVIARVLESEYQIRPQDTHGKHKKCLDLYRNELNEFHQAVLLYNAWYRAEKQRGLSHENSVNLGATVPSDMLNLTIGAISATYTKETLESKYPMAHKLTDEEIQINSDFLSLNPQMHRGKFEIQFLDKFFEFLNKDARGARQYVVNTKGVSIDRKRMISNFEKYVSTPDDMREYVLNGTRRVA